MEGLSFRRLDPRFEFQNDNFSRAAIVRIDFQDLMLAEMATGCPGHSQ